MATNPTPEEVRASIVAKSDQLNADDLVAGPVNVTIAGVRKGDREQPIHIDLTEFPGKSYRPCKTMRRVLIATFSDDPKQWIGQRMTLYCDPEVMWAGVKVGGVRISHLTGLTHPRTFMLTQARGKKSEVTIQPLGTTTDEDKAAVASAMEKIHAASTVEALKKFGTSLKGKSKLVQDAVRPIYAARLEKLKKPSPELAQWLTGINACETAEAVNELLQLPCPPELRDAVAEAATNRKKELETT